MIEWLRIHQLNIMLVLTGICIVTFFFVTFTQAMTKRRKIALMLIELYSAILLISDRLCYQYRGVMTTEAFYIVRIGNFLVFIMTLGVTHAFNLYISDLIKTDAKKDKLPVPMKVAEGLIILGELLVIVSQFTGIYYYFDEFNKYQRGPLYLLSYIIPFVVLSMQFVLILYYHKYFRPMVSISLAVFSLVPLLASVIQFFMYGISFINMSIVGTGVLLYFFALIDMNDTAVRANELEINYLVEEKKEMMRLFDQTATALVNAIDAKDTYTQGHSVRVAEYARKIAEHVGKSEEECEEIYYAGLLHDVGKIGVPGDIINKNGKLTNEEYEKIKTHAEKGGQILSSIMEYPYLSIGSRHHHERFDGKGYPDGLKGEDIPEIARILAVADAYDAMTSKRSYRDPIPQQKVREEIIKGSGLQFDPKFANVMQHLIDLDTEYQMKEKETVKELAGKSDLVCKEYRENISEGIIVTNEVTHVRLKSAPLSNDDDSFGIPSLVLFDSLDGRVHDDEKVIKDQNYFEYGEIWFDGHSVATGARKMETDIKEVTRKAVDSDTYVAIKKKSDKKLIVKDNDALETTVYDLELGRFKDHAYARITSEEEEIYVIIALPDSARWMYIGLTGENCRISDVTIEKTGAVTNEHTIKRIAEEVSYINRIEGDIPNVQIDGYRSDHTEGLEIEDGMKLTFHTMSLPTARLVWHCPFVILYYSEDKKINGPGYKEFALIRFDGENWEADKSYQCNTFVNKNDEFVDWDEWKAINKAGKECEVSFKRKGNKITTSTENCGIAIRNVMVPPEDIPDVYVCLSGDQVALTDIRINK